MTETGELTARRRTFAWYCLANIAATLLLWTLYLTTIRPYVLAVEPAWLARVLAEGVRLVVFVGPTIAAIGCNPYDSWRSYRGMFGRGVAGLGWGLCVGGVLLAVNAVAAYATGRSWTTCLAQVPDAWPVALGPGVLFEELTYRGYFFRNLRSEWGAWAGYLISAVVFVSIHIPGYLLAQHLPAAEMAQHVASIFLLALVLAFVLQKSGSIYAPLLVHAANNFASVVFWK